MSIFFLTIRFDQVVHAQALGFTDHVYQHVAVDHGPLESADVVRLRAELIAKKHFEMRYPPIKVVKMDTRLALQQDPTRYLCLLS